jgi:hypothetical protein
MESTPLPALAEPAYVEHTYVEHAYVEQAREPRGVSPGLFVAISGYPRSTRHEPAESARNRQTNTSAKAR